MSSIFGFLMAVCFIGSFLPQLIKIIYRESSEDISTISFDILLFGYISNIIYNSLIGFYIWSFISSTICGIFTVLSLYFVHKYRRVDKRTKKPYINKPLNQRK